MANYTKLSTKKLTDLLTSEEISDEAKNEISEVLALRNQATQNEVIEKEVIIDPITEEEQAILDQAQVGKKANKLSTEECETLAESLKENIGKLCQTVPAGTIEWQDGQIVGVTIDKRNNKVLYMIKLKDKRILKAYNSEFLKISDEKVEIIRKVRTATAAGVEKVSTDELMKKAEAYSANIGRKVIFVPFKLIEGVEKLAGVIIGITPEKRVGKLLIKIRAEHEGQLLVGYKTEGNYELLEEFDTEVREAYEKRQAMRTHSNVSPEERVKLCQDKVAKAKAELEKWQLALENRTIDLEKAEADYKVYLDSVEKQDANSNIM